MTVTDDEPRDAVAPKIVRTAEIMGTVVSVHVVLRPGIAPHPHAARPHPAGCPVATATATDVAAEPAAAEDIEATEAAEAAATACFAHLRDVERVFSTFRADSDIARMNAGLLTEDRADPRVATVRRACAAAARLTHGRFSARFAGGFDPTGYVKGWAVEAAHRSCLRPLLETPGIQAVGVSAGGDMRLAIAADSDWVWRVGIADPLRAGRLLATVPVTTGAVATSGTAERGAHIVDPRSGRPVTATADATVIADTLTRADVWATAAVVAGPDDTAWVADAPETSGLLISADGAVLRWAAGRPAQAGVPRR